eukprot:SAG31_NODE_1168_length_9568_cov_2.700708_9_plen_85_part_00
MYYKLIDSTIAKLPVARSRTVRVIAIGVQMLMYEYEYEYEYGTSVSGYKLYGSLNLIAPVRAVRLVKLHSICTSDSSTHVTSVR